MDDVGRVVASDPELTWQGSWRFGGHAATLDLDTTTDVGTGAVTVDGLPGQVVFGDRQIYLKAGAEYWTKLGEPAWAAAQHANTWTSLVEPEGSVAHPEILEFNLSELTPVHLGGLLRGSGGNDRASCVGGNQHLARSWKPARSASRPRGVPANAVRFTRPAGRSSCAAGTYWVTPATRQLVGYFGTDEPAVVNGGGATATQTALIARAGTGAQGTDVYQRVTHTVAALPATIQVSQRVNGNPTAGEQGIAECLDDGCSRLTLHVTGGTDSKVLVVSLRITFTLRVEEWQIGQCQVTIAEAGPAGSRPGVCTILNPHPPPGLSLTSDPVAVTYSIDTLLITGSINPAQMAAQIGHAPH
jgi:hypothetical protein